MAASFSQVLSTTSPTATLIAAPLRSTTSTDSSFKKVDKLGIKVVKKVGFAAEDKSDSDIKKPQDSEIGKKRRVETATSDDISDEIFSKRFCLDQSTPVFSFDKDGHKIYRKTPTPQESLTRACSSNLLIEKTTDFTDRAPSAIPIVEPSDTHQKTSEASDEDSTQ